MMVTDAGAESNMHYSSDITRTTPVGGKFNPRQKDIYEIVLKANTESIRLAKPGISNLDLHMNACTIIASSLKELGLMKGDPAGSCGAGSPCPLHASRAWPYDGLMFTTWKGSWRRLCRLQ